MGHTGHPPQRATSPRSRNVTDPLHTQQKTDDFPEGPVAEDPPANAEDRGLIPHLERFHMPQNNYVHAPQLLRLVRSRAHEPQLLGPHVASARALHAESLFSTRKAARMRNLHTTPKEYLPLPARRESPRAAMRTQCSPKFKVSKIKK